MRRPPEYTPICIVLAFAAILGLFSYSEQRGSFLDIAAVASTVILLLVVFSFWCGQSWAWWLLLFAGIYALFRPVLLILHPPPFEAAVIMVEAVLAVPFLIWLILPRVQRYTQGPRG